jgi:aryl-alcohol dehydrogenase-like predicted oxidoreductase
MGGTQLLNRKLGRSGIEVSALGLGTARIGGDSWGDTDITFEDSPEQIKADIDAIHRALEMGVNFIDTADVYSCGLSERILGQALRGQRDRVVLATKFGDTFDEETCQPTEEEITPEYISRACEGSLRRMETDYIDLYLFHINDYDMEKAGEVLETLERLVEEGKIRFYGWSTDYLERARLFAQGTHCTAVEHRLNFMMDAPEMLDLCEEHDLASINRIPLAMGVLSGKWTRETQLPGNDRRAKFFEVERFLEDLDTIQALREVLVRDGRSYVQAALGWIWARSPRTIPVPGFRTAAQVEENAAAMGFGPLSAEQMEEVEGVLGR